MEARLGTNMKSEDVAVRRNVDRLGKESVHRVRLVAGVREKGVEDQLHPRRRVALKDEAVQRVESLRRLIVVPVRRLEVRPPALRRGCVEIVELLELLRIF